MSLAVAVKTALPGGGKPAHQAGFKNADCCSFFLSGNHSVGTMATETDDIPTANYLALWHFLLQASSP